MGAVSAQCGGTSFIKCSPGLIVDDPEAAEAKFHMLPVMLTVLFSPNDGKLTVGSLLADPAVQAAWDQRRSNRPGAVCGEQWRNDHDAAINILRQCPNAVVRMHCELQVLIKAIAEIRNAMHEVYKVVRAIDCNLLHEDLAVPDDEPEEDNLWVAARVGRAENVAAILDRHAERRSQRQREIASGGSSTTAAAAAPFDEQVTVIFNGTGYTTADPNVDALSPWDGLPALYYAAKYGHLPVVLALLERSADHTILNPYSGA